MVRQEDVDNLFAKPGTARRHCMMVTGCIVFDLAIYPLMIWFLFIDVPEFLQNNNDEDAERLTLFIKLVAMCGFTFVVCMYQVILFDLFGQHCTRMREAVLSTSKTDPKHSDNRGPGTDDWTQRQDDDQSDVPEDLMLPGAVRHPMPPIDESPEVTTVQAIPVAQRTPSRTSSAANPDARASPAFIRRYRSDEAVGGRSAASNDQPAASPLEGRCHVCSTAADVASLAAASCGHLVCNSCRPKKGPCPSCKPVAGKSHEKTVSFDRETVFTYIKQTPVQTPR